MMAEATVPETPATARAEKPKELLTSDIQELNDVLVGELAQRGDWVLVNVGTTSFWPVNAQKQMYRGETVWILPITHKHFPAVAMKTNPGLDRGACERLLMRFVSALSWVTEHGMLADSIGGGSLPVPMGRDKTFGFSVT